MPEDSLLKRITMRPDVLDGKPIIRDMRIAVEHVLSMLAAGDDAETILQEYPALEAEDIRGVPDLCALPSQFGAEPQAV